MSLCLIERIGFDFLFFIKRISVYLLLFFEWVRINFLSVLFVDKYATSMITTTYIIFRCFLGIR